MRVLWNGLLSWPRNTENTFRYSHSAFIRRNDKRHSNKLWFLGNICQMLTIEDIQVDKRNKHSPVRPYQRLVHADGTQYTNRIMIGTACTGLVRIEWVSARYSQIIPMNWSMLLVTQVLGSYIPLGYLVADAQNMIVKAAMEEDMEWLCFIEHDVVIPSHTFLAFNTYMREERVPVVSGLYFTRSRPAEPLVFRGRGTNIHTGWEMGEKVWVD